jgi:hypothetical protein
LAASETLPSLTTNIQPRSEERKDKREESWIAGYHKRFASDGNLVEKQMSSLANETAGIIGGRLEDTLSGEGVLPGFSILEKEPLSAPAATLTRPDLDH